MKLNLNSGLMRLITEISSKKNMLISREKKETESQNLYTELIRPKNYIIAIYNKSLIYQRTLKP